MKFSILRLKACSAHRNPGEGGGPGVTPLFTTGPQRNAGKPVLSTAEGLFDSLACHAVKPCFGFYCMVNNPGWILRHNAV